MSKANKKQVVTNPEQQVTAPDQEIAAAQATEQAKQNWRNPESVQDRHIMASLVQDGVAPQLTPVEFAQKVVELRKANGATPVRSHAQDSMLVEIGPKPYRVRASAVGGSKNEYVGYWALVTTALQTGPKTQRELADLVGRLDFIRYCLNRDWLKFVAK